MSFLLSNFPFDLSLAKPAVALILGLTFERLSYLEFYLLIFFFIFLDSSLISSVFTPIYSSILRQ